MGGIGFTSVTLAVTLAGCGSSCFLLRRLAMWSVVDRRDDDLFSVSCSSQLDTGLHTTLSTDDALLLLLLLDLPASSLAVESLFRLPLLSSRTSVWRLTLDDLDDTLAVASCDLAAISDSWRLICADCTADAVVCVSLLTFCGFDVCADDVMTSARSVVVAADDDDDDADDVEWLGRLDVLALTAGPDLTVADAEQSAGRDVVTSFTKPELGFVCLNAVAVCCLVLPTPRLCARPSTSATRLELMELADWRTDTEARVDDDELCGLLAVATGAMSLLGLVPAAERCDGAGIADALNVELDVLLYDVLTSLMHVAAAAAADDDDDVAAVDRVTRDLLDDARFASQVSIDCVWQLFDVGRLPPASPACRAVPAVCLDVLLVVVVAARLCMAAVPLDVLLVLLLLVVVLLTWADDTAGWLDFLRALPATTVFEAGDVDVLFLELRSFSLSSIDAWCLAASGALPVPRAVAVPVVPVVLAVLAVLVVRAVRAQFTVLMVVVVVERLVVVVVRDVWRWLDDDVLVTTGSWEVVERFNATTYVNVQLSYDSSQLQ